MINLDQNLRFEIDQNLGFEIGQNLRFEVGQNLGFDPDQNLRFDICEICDFYPHSSTQDFKTRPDLLLSLFSQILIIFGKNNYNFTPQIKAFCL